MATGRFQEVAHTASTLPRHARTEFSIDRVGLDRAFPILTSRFDVSAIAAGARVHFFCTPMS
jgi:hypothetical protein